MSKISWIILIINCVCLVVTNVIMWKEKTNFKESKLLPVSFFCLKLTTILPIAYVCVILFTFAYSYVNELNSIIYRNVIYYYLVYGVLFFGTFIVYSTQWKILATLSSIIFALQCYSAYIIQSNNEIYKYAGAHVINIYRYGDSIGTLIAFSGVILSGLALLSLLHYYKRRFC